MRPIDADAFKEYLKQGTELALKEAMFAGTLTKEKEKQVNETLEGFLEDIDEQPTINECTLPKANMLKENLVKILGDYFQIGNDTCCYNLTRDKEAFSTGTMSFDDFEEFDEETVNDLAEYIANKITEGDGIDGKMDRCR